MRGDEVRAKLRRSVVNAVHRGRIEDFIDEGAVVSRLQGGRADREIDPGARVALAEIGDDLHGALAASNHEDTRLRPVEARPQERHCAMPGRYHEEWITRRSR